MLELTVLDDAGPSKLETVLDDAGFSVLEMVLEASVTGVAEGHMVVSDVRVVVTVAGPITPFDEVV